MQQRLDGSVRPSELWRVLCISFFLPQDYFLPFLVFDTKKKYIKIKNSFVIIKFFFQI